MIEILYIFSALCGGVIFTYIYLQYLYKKKNFSLEKQYIDESNELKNRNSIFIERVANLAKEKEEIKSQLIDQRSKNDQLIRTCSSLNTRCNLLEDTISTQKEELITVQKKLNSEFENIANKILKENTKEFTIHNKNNIDALLSPLKEKIISFEKKVEETYDKELRDKISLKEEVLKLYELNNRISTEANNLTKALKGDVKKQGCWGELILEKILERSGLNKEIHYEKEYVCKNIDGKTIRPDIIIKLPDNKHIIVDAKVSLVAYERLVNSTDTKTIETNTKDHIRSIKSHIQELSKKHYQSSESFKTPDFVLMFLPIESSFSIAIEKDKDLFNYAWDSKVVIVSPSTLLASLKTIASVWKYENQNKNVIEIARQSGALYDKFVSFIEDINKLGKQVDNTKNAYDSAVKKLYEGNGNLVRRAENIRKLGANVKKTLSKDTINKVYDEESIN